jgi:hypothetical protein
VIDEARRCEDVHAASVQRRCDARDVADDVEVIADVPVRSHDAVPSRRRQRLREGGVRRRDAADPDATGEDEALEEDASFEDTMTTVLHDARMGTATPPPTPTAKTKGSRSARSVHEGDRTLLDDDSVATSRRRWRGGEDGDHDAHGEGEAGAEDAVGR